jgi:hypothetical protein
VTKFTSETFKIFGIAISFSEMGHAEVSDKCPSFVNHWVESKGTWEFLTTQEAMIRLGQFIVLYSAVAGIFYYFARRSAIKWLKYIPLFFSFVIAIYLSFEFIPHGDPCSHYVWLKETPETLLWIQLFFDAVLLFVPIALLSALKKKNT